MRLENLIEDCKKGDARAQESIYRLFSGKLFGVCLKYSDNYENAQDTLQDGFITIFDKIKQFKSEGSFEGWMRRIMVNTALLKYRKQTVFDIINEEEIEEIQVEITEEVSLDYLLSLIQELPDRYRLVFNLYVLDGYNHNEIATMLSISNGTSKSNLARARKILKDKIEARQYVDVHSVER
ncbi:sigma-70 family RNA polymerase sigma factor [Aquimarina sp. ERC-38]|uniref:RNA polymerase sigma factor n=1 Tax=Aquimarina sp. ERC-38 TaxID=2949996 RepID=UPI0022453EF5|nr:sigma-70 family RNA polymerase sigma factor [Aquimarina sp. ERC-38]UZO82031.1 sigma-70 family RNA polymerase sigma factor [Aquimarina sp. ERC-38]